jgi:hypothetical protein
MRILRAIASLMFSLFVVGCSEDAATRTNSSTVQTSEGVVLHGCGSGSGWIQNTNVYPVRVRRVWRFRGEGTQSINQLAPGAKYVLSRISYRHGFYIYLMDGVLVGWISGECPEE